MASHTVYAVASGKGGVGKTATTVNLGASLAEAGYTVAIVDTDLGMANLGGFIGIEPELTLHEVLAGDASLEESTYEALNGLAVVPSGISLNGFANVETASLADAVDALRDAFDYVLLDLGAGLSHDTVLPLALADAVILVSTPQPAAVQDTAKTREITERLGGRVAGVVLTRAGNPADLTLEEVEDTLQVPVLASIPEDNVVPASAREGQAVLQYDPDSPVVEGYRGLAGIIEAESLADAPVVPEMPEPEAPPEPAGADAEAAEAADADASGSSETTAAEEEPVAEATAAAAASGDAEASDEGVDDAEKTAAEIAAAIEDAAGGAKPDAGSAADQGAEADAGAAASEATSNEAGTADAGAADAEGATDSDSESGGEPVDEVFTGEDGDGESASADESATAEAEAAESSGDAGAEETFKVESTVEEESDEGQAVDELFSVEGASPDELDDDEDEEEEDSGGLLGGLLG